MESCSKKLCHIIVDFIERFLKLIIAPFRLDKLLALAGLSLVASPTFIDFKGKLNVQTSYFNGELSFTNGVDVISYVCGGLLIVTSIYLYRKKEFLDDTPQHHQALISAIENRNENNQSSIQFWFSKIYKIHGGIDEILYLMKKNNPHHSISDYSKSIGLVEYNNGFKLKDKVNLTRRKRFGATVYFSMAALAFISYMFFIGLIAQGKSLDSFVVLLLTIAFGFISYIGLDKHSSAYAAERLVADK